jgi:CRP-like cAMP-binding protein
MDTSLKFSIIREHALFESISSTDLQWLAEQSSFKRLQKGEKIYDEGTDANMMYLLVKGTVKVCLNSSSGKILIKNIIHQEEIFGENLFSGVDIRQDFAQAFNGEVQILCLRKDHVLSMIMRYPKFTENLTSVIIERLGNIERRMENYVYKKAKNRIVDFILQTGKRKGIKIGLDECLINHGMSHKEIAYLTDTSRQTVARVLGELKRANLIHFSTRKPSKILIRNMVALQA